MSITANRHRGIRAAVCTTPEMARLSRQHNHANVLCLGRRLLSIEECKEIVDAWLEEPYMLSIETKLALADSIILATAHAHDAELWTQDSDFEGLEGVRYRAAK